MNNENVHLTVRKYENSESIVAYVLKKPLLGKDAGEVVHLDDTEAEPLVSSGYLEEAKDEDMAGNEVTDAEEMPQDECVTSKAVARIQKGLEQSIVKATESAVTRLTKAPAGNMPYVSAQPKEPVFKNLTDQLLCMFKDYKFGDQTSRNRLKAFKDETRVKAPLGFAETSQSTGLYSIKPEWADTIFRHEKRYPDLFSMCKRIGLNSNQYQIPVISELGFADGVRNAGVLSYYQSEGNTATTSYPAGQTVIANLDTLTTNVVATVQSLQDFNIEQGGFEKWISEIVAEEIAWQQMVAVTAGAGGGSLPVGVLNQPALITVATTSAAHTISFADISAMYAAMYPTSRGNSVWLVSPTVWQTILQMSFTTGGAYPAAGINYDYRLDFPLTIYGRPVLECISLPSVGLTGDILYVDLKQLHVPEHPGLQVRMSEELYFLSLQTVFQFNRRYTVVSPWTAPMTSADGHRQWSPFVSLSSRGS